MSHRTMSDPANEFRSLLNRASRGDTIALRQLTNQYETQILIVARARLGPALRPFVDSMDLVQSVHRVMISGFLHERFDLSSPQRLVNLAITLLKRKVAHKWRRMRRNLRLQTSPVGLDSWVNAFESLASSEPDPARAAESRDLVQLVLSGLRADDRRL